MRFTAHSLAEYRSIFLLQEMDFNRSFLDVGAGLSSFNSELTKLGHRVISIDVLYDQGVEVVRNIVEKHDQTPVMRGQIEPLEFLDPLACEGITRQATTPAAKVFLSDYASGQEEKRYRWGLLPSLNFERNSFNLALCAHVLFSPVEKYNVGFHVDAISNLVYVADEARIGPIDLQDEYVNGLWQEVEPELKRFKFKTELKENRYNKGEVVYTLFVRK